MPERHVLYQYDVCPFCRRVRQYVAQAGIDLEMRDTLHDHFQLGETEMLYCGMAVGWPDPDHPVNQLRAERASVDEIAELKGF